MVCIFNLLALVVFADSFSEGFRQKFPRAVPDCTVTQGGKCYSQNPFSSLSLRHPSKWSLLVVCFPPLTLSQLDPRQSYPPQGSDVSRSLSTTGQLQTGDKDCLLSS